MKRFICALLSFVLLLTLFPFAYADADTLPFSDDPKAIQVASNSVIMLSCYDKDGNLYATGSAFAAFEEGVFVTNCHVIQDEVYSIRASMETGLEFSIKTVVAYDVEKDIAILRTEAKTGINPLPIGSNAALERAEKVIAIGSPLGLMNTISIGLYSGIIKNENEQKFLQFSAPISHGSSGGALFNSKGEVVGITSASFTEGQNLNLAIPIEDAVILWEKRDNSAELSIRDFYELWDHIQLFSVSYILSHRREFNSSMIINTSGYVFYDPSSFDPSSQTKRDYWLVETAEDYYAIFNAFELLNSYGGKLSESEKANIESGYVIAGYDSDLKRIYYKRYEVDEYLAKHYEAQINYENLLDKTALSVSGYKQNGTVALGEYVIIQGEAFNRNGEVRLKKVTVIEKSGN